LGVLAAAAWDVGVIAARCVVRDAKVEVIEREPRHIPAAPPAEALS
jgi:hypothetical protein